MVDYFSRYTWVEFLSTKDEAPQIIIEHIKRVDKEAQGTDASVAALRIDNGTDIINATLNDFCRNRGISQ